MGRLSRKERFIRSKCDRCGKSTSAKQNDTGDLYVLDESLGPGVADQGDFCYSCATKYSREDWLAWLKKYRPTEA